MNKRSIILIALGLCFAAQWFVPGQMILAKEKVETHGALHKFRVAPIDPYDPFRGRYLVLDYKDDELDCSHCGMFTTKSTDSYILFKEDNEGYSVPYAYSIEVPEGSDYLKCRVRLNHAEDKLRITYPITRYYMNEEMAPKAELIYNEGTRERKEAWVEAKIKDGDVVIQDVKIEGRSINELAREALQD